MATGSTSRSYLGINHYGPIYSTAATQGSDPCNLEEAECSFPNKIDVSIVSSNSPGVNIRDGLICRPVKINQSLIFVGAVGWSLHQLKIFPVFIEAILSVE